jgi:hypothetical protein
LSSAVVYQTTLGIYLKKSLSFPVTAEQSKLSAPECGTGPVGEFLSSTPLEREFLSSTPTEREFLSSTPTEREFLSSTPTEREFLSSTPTEREFLSSTPPEREFLSSTPPEREFLSSASEGVESTSHHFLFRFEGEVRQ